MAACLCTFTCVKCAYSCYKYHLLSLCRLLKTVSCYSLTENTFYTVISSAETSPDKNWRTLVTVSRLCLSSQSLHRCCQWPVRLLVARGLGSSSSVSPPPLHTKFFLFLTQRFYDIEMLFNWRAHMKRRRVQKKNA